MDFTDWEGAVPCWEAIRMESGQPPGTAFVALFLASFHVWDRCVGGRRNWNKKGWKGNETNRNIAWSRGVPAHGSPEAALLIFHVNRINFQWKDLLSVGLVCNRGTAGRTDGEGVLLPNVRTFAISLTLQSWSSILVFPSGLFSFVL